MFLIEKIYFAGAVLAAPASTFCIRRYGSGFSSICGSLLLVCVAIVLGVPGELWLLAIALTLLVRKTLLLCRRSFYSEQSDRDNSL